MGESVRDGLAIPVEECDGTRLVKEWRVIFTKQAQKDAKKL